MNDVPSVKKIGTVSVTISEHGWPHWTRIERTDREGVCIMLGHEQARDMLYAMQRIVAFLDKVDAEARR